MTPEASPCHTVQGNRTDEPSLCPLPYVRFKTQKATQKGCTLLCRDTEGYVPFVSRPFCVVHAVAQPAAVRCRAIESASFRRFSWLTSEAPGS
jgi:hypothetical protein